MRASKNSKECLRLPEWLRIKLPENTNFSQTDSLVHEYKLNTVCRSAKCPNIFECFSKHVATFMVLGTTCTRACAFCNIGHEPGILPELVDAKEPERLALAAASLGLKYVVVTSVTRDDLPDGGASHFAEVIQQLRKKLPGAGVEVLIPDFQGDAKALQLVLDAAPDIINHNVETVPSLYKKIRPQAGYEQSLELLARVQSHGARAKSGFMVGLGETDEQVRVLIQDLAQAGCEIITIGQYMRPTRKHIPVERYVHPDVFTEYAEYAKSCGIAHAHSAPLVRSSYNAADFAGK